MQVPIIEHYDELDPPEFWRSTIEGLLNIVPAAYLAGLGSVVLRDVASLDSRDSRRKAGGKGRAVLVRECLGLYHRARRGRAASIELFVDNILRATPRWYLTLPWLREIALAKVLYHEVGHHIHHCFAPEHRQREQVAEEWMDAGAYTAISTKEAILLPSSRSSLARSYEPGAKGSAASIAYPTCAMSGCVCFLARSRVRLWL